MTQKVMVYKLDEQGNEVWRYPATVLERTPQCIQLEAYFNRETVDLGQVVFARGDRFIETFYSDRWYNVFAIYATDSGAFKGWYCNICRPAEISDGAVRSADLALDVWVEPSGATTLMDEDEFAGLEISSQERRQSREALEQILQRANDGHLPG